jgi:hypothetical protein
MKINGRTILQRLYGVTRWGNRVSRARYFRGHGVHSPFVYAIVRQVFMQSTPIAEDGLFGDLCSAGIARRRAVQLRNLVAHCSYSRVGIDCECEGYDFVVLTANFPTERLSAMADEARVSGTTLAVVAPYANRERDVVCRHIVETHRSTTVDNRGYLLIFNNHLPKQHFKL